MRVARGWTLTAILAIALFALPAGASAWQATFSKFFSFSGVNGQGHKLVMQKCHGGKLGNWTLTAKHYILLQDNENDLFVRLEMKVKVPVTTDFKKLSVQKLEVTHSDSYPDEAAEEIVEALTDFFNKSFAKSNSDASKLTFRQNGLRLGGEYVIEPDETTAPFKVEPGCSPV